jgi:hypothetical protein
VAHELSIPINKIGPELDTLSQLLVCHNARYPQMQMQDLYKLLHQAALGSEHAVHDEQAARDWLERELAEMGAGSDDPLLDPITVDGQILRVHLRPYLKAGKNPEILLQAFIQTANEWRGTLDTLKEHAAAVLELAHSESFQFSSLKFMDFFAKMESQDFPACHHSEIYKRLYRPAYRVVNRQYLEEI